MTLPDLHNILGQAVDTDSVEWIYFEGGEPFLYYSTLLEGVKAAAKLGFRVGIVSNAYWATSLDDALAALGPLAGLVQDFSISSDAYHGYPEPGAEIHNALEAAQQLGIPVDPISSAPPEELQAAGGAGQIPAGESAVVYRGRAAKKLAAKVEQSSWETYTECPFEDLETPDRVHLDPLGYVHICQGISIGNVFDKPLSTILRDYDPQSHAVTGPLNRGGPAELVRTYQLDCRKDNSDACHLCYEARCALRGRLPRELAPDQMYGPDQR
jgi:hypothetical protein